MLNSQWSLTPNTECLYIIVVPTVLFAPLMYLQIHTHTHTHTHTHNQRCGIVPIALKVVAQTTEQIHGVSMLESVPHFREAVLPFFVDASIIKEAWYVVANVIEDPNSIVEIINLHQDWIDCLIQVIMQYAVNVDEGNPVKSLGVQAVAEIALKEGGPEVRFSPTATRKCPNVQCQCQCQCQC